MSTDNPNAFNPLPEGDYITTLSAARLVAINDGADFESPEEEAEYNRVMELVGKGLPVIVPNKEGVSEGALRGVLGMTAKDQVNTWISCLRCPHRGFPDKQALWKHIEEHHPEWAKTLKWKAEHKDERLAKAANKRARRAAKRRTNLRPDPNCTICHGEGSYWEDVAGDGGSRMQVNCECWS